MSVREVAWRYVGQEWIPSVPARNLTAEEYEIYRDRIETNYRATGRHLYEAVGIAKPDRGPRAGYKMEEVGESKDVAKKPTTGEAE